METETVKTIRHIHINGSNVWSLNSPPEKFKMAGSDKLFTFKNLQGKFNPDYDSWVYMFDLVSL